MAERYGVLPHTILQATPEELYLDLLVTFPPDEIPRPPQPRRKGDPSWADLIRQMQGATHG
jgi:hypothetical protein